MVRLAYSARVAACPVARCCGFSGDGEQLCSVAGELGVELVVGLAGGGLQGGLVVQAGAQEVRQHRLDLDQVAELGVRGGQADGDRLVQRGGQVDRAQGLDGLVLRGAGRGSCRGSDRWG